MTLRYFDWILTPLPVLLRLFTRRTGKQWEDNV